MWNSLITLMNESYMIVIVCLLINLRIFSLETGGLATMSLLCVTFVTASIVLPGVFFIKLLIHGKKLDQRPVQ